MKLSRLNVDSHKKP